MVQIHKYLNRNRSIAGNLECGDGGWGYNTPYSVGSFANLYLLVMKRRDVWPTWEVACFVAMPTCIAVVPWSLGHEWVNIVDPGFYQTFRSYRFWPVKLYGCKYHSLLSWHTSAGILAIVSSTTIDWRKRGIPSALPYLSFRSPG